MCVGDTFEQLLIWLEGEEARDAVSVVTRLLRYCRQEDIAVRIGEQSRALGLLRTNVSHQATKLLLTEKGTLLSPTLLRGLADVLRKEVARAGSGPAEKGVGVRRLALALDGTHGKCFLTHLKAYGTRTLETGDFTPFPCMHAKLTRLYGHRLGTSPVSRDDRVDVLPRYGGLVPPLHGAMLEVRYDGDSLDALDESSSIACVFPEKRADLKMPSPESRAGESFFFGVAPGDPRAAEREALRLSLHADELGARVVVLPELSLDESGAQRLASWARDDAKNILLAVCGSYHAEIGDLRANIAVYSLRGAERHEHRKHERYRWEGAFEDLDVKNRRLTVHFGVETSFAVVICLDALRGLRRILEDLRVALVFVPACSPRTSDFHSVASGLATAAQAHVLVANLCDNMDSETGRETESAPASALLSRPVQGRGDDIVAEHPCNQLQAPAAALIRLSHGGWSCA